MKQLFGSDRKLKVQPYLRAHGRSVELLGKGNEVVRLRLPGSGKGCGPLSMTARKLSIKEAIDEAAPDVTAIEAHEVAAPPAPARLRVNWKEDML